MHMDNGLPRRHYVLALGSAVGTAALLAACGTGSQAGTSGQEAAKGAGPVTGRAPVRPGGGSRAVWEW